jgi:hypothetical protein
VAAASVAVVVAAAVVVSLLVDVHLVDAVNS